MLYVGNFYSLWISIFRFFSKQIRWLFIFVHNKSLKFAFKTSFSVHNIHLYLCGQVRILDGYCVVEKWELKCIFKIYVVQKFFSTYQHKYECILCIERLVLNASFLMYKSCWAMITFHDVWEAINLVKKFKKICVIAKLNLK